MVKIFGTNRRSLAVETEKYQATSLGSLSLCGKRVKARRINIVMSAQLW